MGVVRTFGLEARICMVGCLRLRLSNFQLRFLEKVSRRLNTTYIADH
jgi:hypothetical protein